MRVERAYPFVAAAVGAAMVFHPTLLSLGAQVQTDLGDTRLVGFILEHGWQWVSGRAPSFADYPMFYPVAGTAWWCETLAGVQPVYWLFRALGADRYAALQLWMVALSLLNFDAAYRLLRGPVGATRLGSSAGAFLFAFSALRANQLCHHQLLAAFFTAWAAHCLARLVQTRRTRWAWLLGLSVGGQFLAGVYLGWFLVFGLALFAAVWLATRADRVPRALELAPLLAIAAVPAALVAGRAAVAYAEVGRQFQWSYADVEPYVAGWRTWLAMGKGSWLYSWTALESLGPAEIEHRCGLGFATALVAATGLLRSRRWATAGSAVLLVLVATAAWPLVFRFVPGGSGIRTPCRIGELLLVPAAVGVTLVVEAARSRGWRWAAPLLAVICAEQGVTTRSFDKEGDRQEIRELASRVDPSCSAFVYAPEVLTTFPEKYQLDAMWTALETGVPTVNGYSGHVPPGWPQSSFDQVSGRLCLVR